MDELVPLYYSCLLVKETRLTLTLIYLMTDDRPPKLAVKCIPQGRRDWSRAMK